MDVYEVRRSLAEKPSSYRLDGGALIRSVEGREHQRITLGDLQKVHLAYQPAGIVPRWVCKLEGPSGHVWLPSASFTGFGRVTDQRAAFRGFVETLHQAIAAEPGASNIAFVQGGGASPVLALVMFIVLMAMCVLLVMGALGSMMGGAGAGAATWAILPLIVVLYAALMIWPIWRLNRRRVYAPTALPADFAAG